MFTLRYNSLDNVLFSINSSQFYSYVILLLFLFSTNDVKVDSCIGIHNVKLFFFQQGSYLTKQCQHYF